MLAEVLVAALVEDAVPGGVVPPVLAGVEGPRQSQTGRRGRPRESKR